MISETAFETVDSIEITNGGSKSELLAQLGDIGRVHPRPTFRLNLGILGHQWVTQVLINQVGIEDGSGENWLIWGYVPRTNQKFEGYYSTRNRRGWIKFQ